MTGNPHLHQDQLIEHLYCASELAAEHLSMCVECQARFLEIERRRAELTAQPVLPNEYFQRQRRAVVASISNIQPKSPLSNIWVPSTLAVVLAAGVMIGSAFTAASRHTVEQATEEMADSLEILEPGWFDETYTAMQVVEPRAASPIVHLFQQQSVVE